VPHYYLIILFQNGEIEFYWESMSEQALAMENIRGLELGIFLLLTYIILINHLTWMTPRVMFNTWRIMKNEFFKILSHVYKFGWFTW